MNLQTGSGWLSAYPSGIRSLLLMSRENTTIHLFTSLKMVRLMIFN